MRLVDNRVIARNPGWRRRVAKALLDRGPEYNLIAFRLADTHLHALALTTKRQAAQLARRAEISISLRRRHTPGFAKVWLKPVQDQRHLQNLFAYIHGQERHHAINADPHHDGGNLPDLLGLRTTGAYAIEKVRQVLPRVDRRQLLDALGVTDLHPADGPLDLLPDAAAAAMALPHLRGSTREVRQARRAAAEVAGDRLRRKDLARLLHTSTPALRRDRGLRPDPALVRAIRLQLGFRAARQHRIQED